MAYVDPVRDHQEWINYLQPEGLVVSARALVDNGAILDNGTLRERQAQFRAVVLADFDGDEPHLVPDLAPILRDFLSWPAEQLDDFSQREPAPELTYTNPDLGLHLAPRFALRSVSARAGESRWLLLAHALAAGEKLDVETDDGSRWKTTPSRRFERLLRETKIPIGVIADATSVRLVYAPPQESTGTLTFPLRAMTEVAGRKIVGAFHELLCARRLFTGSRDQRLPALLEKSRNAQAAVSTALAEQVLESLYEFVRGFQAADAHTNGALLRELLAQHPDRIYQGLLNVLLRLITLLYAEDRALLPQSELFVRNYSLRGLFERLRADRERYVDTMDMRYGAWHQLLVLFRLVHSGCAHPGLKVPARRGGLFDPERFPFLEGRTLGEPHIPLVPDGTVYRVLEKLLIVDGERLSYRTLDVEHIGSVYETMMGFRMERASGPSIALKPTKKGGAPTTIDLEALLAEPPAKRAEWIKKNAEQKIDGKALEALKTANSPEALRTALERKIATSATPDIVAKGSMVLQPSDERRKSGSHYTPRSLTEPIVRKTFQPIFARLGSDATAEQVLDLRVCDPAMGSGAFLVEACRQLAARVKQAWERHRVAPTLPPDEDIDLYAMRLIAQRCLYGVDKNPVATDLAKLSLWLATFARDHAFTFVDHALRHGDSLVGLSLSQIEVFHWDTRVTWESPFRAAMRAQLQKVSELRQLIRIAQEGVSDRDLRELWNEAQSEGSKVRLYGDLVVAAFLEGDKPKDREARRGVYVGAIVRGEAEQYRERLDARRHGDRPLVPFHWQVEFPEVFERPNPGFDAFVGNPPFMASRGIWSSFGTSYRDILQVVHEEIGGKAVDVIAHFFRRAFSLLRDGGTLGLLATNTLSQGDTRAAGLKYICNHGGTIYGATRRLRWPGLAAVVVCVVHVEKTSATCAAILDGRPVHAISSFLFAGSEIDPQPLRANLGVSFLGSKVYGLGFTFSDHDGSGQATSLAEMKRLIEKDIRNAERVFPYIGGEEINSSPTQSHHRFTINFANMSIVEAERWPDLLSIVREKVWPERQQLGGYSVADRRNEVWWQFGTYAAALHSAIAFLPRCLAISRVSAQYSVAFQDTGLVFADTVVVFAFAKWASFTALQSRTHEVWARFFSSSFEDRLRYTSTDCFETFPFAPDFESNPAFEAAGKAYYEFRAELMVRNNEGLTKTYNRFHNESETSPAILQLRELHAAMDRVVLDAYGWTDIPITCEFIPDYSETDDDGNEAPKSIRYRWPDEIRDEVLARLLILNQQRHDAEVRLGLHAQPKSRGRRKPKASAAEGLFE